MIQIKTLLIYGYSNGEERTRSTLHVKVGGTVLVDSLTIKLDNIGEHYDAGTYAICTRTGVWDINLRLEDESRRSLTQTRQLRAIESFVESTLRGINVEYIKLECDFAFAVQAMKFYKQYLQTANTYKRNALTAYPGYTVGMVLPSVNLNEVKPE